jgi:hypothetical protein
VNERFVPIGRVARWAMILLAAIVVLDAIAVVSDLEEIRVTNRLIEGELVTEDELDASGTRQDAIAAVQSLLYLATTVVFIRWFRRAYRNLAPLAAPHPRFKSWWTIGGWFIPIANLFRPKQILNDIWRGSDRELRRYGDVPWVFGLWWFLWIVSNYASNVGLRLAFTGETLGELRNSSIAYLVSDATDAPLAALAILVVRMTTSRQEQRAAVVASGNAPPTPAAP